ncbi:unnamed protein product [Owenia fusiformis]|uniref:LIM zinc-binding domain-containing protein n=1 Tax=Owenia fusiformis TaxID=6347 RepID=A0A8S4N3G3_OWEFU|nr:unnamed protein product [Owenia fusiformis]
MSGHPHDHQGLRDRENSPSRQHYVTPSFTAQQYKKVGLPTYKPVIYPNPADLEDDLPPPPPAEPEASNQSYAYQPSSSSIPSASSYSNATYASVQYNPTSSPSTGFQMSYQPEPATAKLYSSPNKAQFATTSSRPAVPPVSTGASGTSGRNYENVDDRNFSLPNRSYYTPPAGVSDDQSYRSPQQPDYQYRGPGPRSPPGINIVPPTPPATQQQQFMPSPPPAAPKTDLDKEAEVDALTNLLLKNMECASDPDFYGMCAKCHTAIMGDTNGCKALGQVYHVKCFTCLTCSSQLQGQAFFAMEGKPYCETCYMDTLEKCSLCKKAITDRILRATGKPYHAHCFVCVVCGKSLDGIPFTVDASNNIHCIDDFHAKFAPKCCVCSLPIVPEPGQEETVRIVAMDKSFHTGCYKCEDCGMILSSESDGKGCYPLDDHILCKNCNARRIQTMTTKKTTDL